MEKLNIFVPITKVDVAKRLIYGTIAAEVADKSGEILDYATAKGAFQTWSDEITKNSGGKSAGNLRVMHQPIIGGKFEQIGFDDATKKINGVAHVSDDATWDMVEKGILTAFSLGGGYAKRWADEGDAKLKRYTPTINEVSLVDNPCIPGSTFEMIKLDGSTELRKFVPSPLTEKAIELAKAAGAWEKWPEYMVTAKQVVEAEKATKLADKPAEETNDAAVKAALDTTKAAPDAAKVAPQNGDDFEQVWKSARDGKTFKTKAELIVYHRTLDATKAAGETVAPVLAALQAVSDELVKREPIDPEKLRAFIAANPDHEAVKAFLTLSPDSDPAAFKSATDALHKATFAAPASATSGLAGYQLEGAKKKDYSKDERDKLASAGKAMKDGSFPIDDKADLANAVSAYGRAGNKAAAKRHIVKRARALGATDLLPKDWRGSTQKLATPELQKAADLYSVSNLIGLLASMEQVEEELEGETPAIYGYPTPSARTKIAVSKALTDRFGSTLVEFGDCVAELLDELLMTMGDEERAEAAKLAGGLDLVKAYARHSKKDQKAIQAAHDHTVLAGAECGGKDDSKDGESADKLAKADAHNGALTKTISDMLPMLTDVLARVKKIEATPMPGGPRLSGIHTVTKAEDNSAELEKTVKEMTEEQAILHVLKLVQSRGATQLR